MRVRTAILCLAITLLVVSPGVVEAKWIKGHKVTSTWWGFLGKFCFDQEGKGQMDYTITTGTTEAAPDGIYPRLLFFDDEHSLDGYYWNVYPPNLKGLSCLQLVNVSKHLVRAPNVLPGIPIENGKAKQTLFADSRPHYWYIMIADCRSPDSKIDVEYDIKFQNAGAAWTAQFSYDDQGLLIAYIIFFVIFAIMVFIHLKDAIPLYQKKVLHPMVKILTTAVCLQLFAVILIMIHWSIYSGDGVGVPFLDGIGQLSDMGCQVALTFLLFLMARGWAISTQKVEHKRFYVVLVTVLSLFFLFIFIWEYVGVDPASVVYIYESVPGLLFLLFRIILWILWLIYLVGTARGEQDETKKQLYVVIAVLYSLWFFGLPLIAMAAALISPTARNKSVMSLYMIMNTLALGVLCYLLAPKRAEAYFQIKGPDLMAEEGRGTTAEGVRADGTPYENL